MVGNDKSLRGRRILLTGASRGLGRELALAFRAAGADLCLVARASPHFDALLRHLRDVGNPDQTIEHAELDLADTESAAALACVYGPDVLVNNAAEQGPIGRLHEVPSAAWQRTLTVDLVLPASLMAAVMPGMIARGNGVIVNLAGGGAARSRPRFSAYAAAKAGLVRLTECVADEVREHGIAVTAVAPGALPTGMLDEIVETGPERAGADEFAKARDTLAAGAAEAGRHFRQVTDFCLYLAAGPRMDLSGRLVAPRWDPWLEPSSFGVDALMLRRVEPATASSP